MVSQPNGALWLIPALPLATAVVNLFWGRRLGRWAGWLASASVALSFVVELFLAIRAGVGFSTRAPDVFTANEGGNTQAVAKVLFTQYFFPFEVTSVLLLVAAVAAMVLAHRKARTVTQAEIDAAAASADADEMPVYGAGATP